MKIWLDLPILYQVRIPMLSACILLDILTEQQNYPASITTAENYIKSGPLWVSSLKPTWDFTTKSFEWMASSTRTVVLVTPGSYFCIGGLGCCITVTSSFCFDGVEWNEPTEMFAVWAEDSVNSDEIQHPKTANEDTRAGGDWEPQVWRNNHINVLSF